VVAFDAAGGADCGDSDGMPAEAPVMTYEVDGEKYVAIATGGSTQAVAKGDGRGPSSERWTPALATAPKTAANRRRRTWRDCCRPGTVGIGASDSGEYAYAPAKNHIKAGSTVTWTNNGSLEHTRHVPGRIGLDSGLLSTGQSACIRVHHARHLQLLLHAAPVDAGPGVRRLLVYDAYQRYFDLRHFVRESSL